MSERPTWQEVHEEGYGSPLEGSYEQVRNPKKPPNGRHWTRFEDPERREDGRCAEPGCPTQLSIYNPSPKCFLHQPPDPATTAAAYLDTRQGPKETP